MADALIKIPVELFAVAESSHFEGELDWPSMTTGLDDLAFEGPVTWAVDVLNTEGALLVTGSAQEHAKTTCARCLGDAEIDLDGEIEGWFLLSEESAMPEDVDEDEVQLEVHTGCPSITSMMENLGDTFETFDVCLQKPGTGPFFDYAREHFPVHVSCPTINGIIKAMEVEGGLALPHDASIKFVQE